MYPVYSESYGFRSADGVDAHTCSSGTYSETGSPPGTPQERGPFGVGALEQVPAQPALGVLVVQQVDEPVRRLPVVAFPPGDPGGEVLGEVPGGLGRRLGRNFA